MTSVFAFVAIALATFACSSNAPPAPQSATPPRASTPADAGVDAPTTTATAPPKESPPEEKLTCPSPAVAAALRSCEGIDASIPTVSAISDIQQKIAMAEMRGAPPKKQPKTEAERLAPKPLTKGHKEFFKATRTFLCKNETSREHNEIAYLEARYYFELQHWEEAAVILDEMALGPYTDTSPYAAQLALEAFNVLATKLNRADCTKTLEVRIHQYIRQLCDSPATRGADANTCATFRKVRDDLKASPRRSAP